MDPYISLVNCQSIKRWNLPVSSNMEIRQDRLGRLLVSDRLWPMARPLARMRSGLGMATLNQTNHKYPMTSSSPIAECLLTNYESLHT